MGDGRCMCDGHLLVKAGACAKIKDFSYEGAYIVRTPGRHCYIGDVFRARVGNWSRYFLNLPGLDRTGSVFGLKIQIGYRLFSYYCTRTGPNPPRLRNLS